MKTAGIITVVVALAIAVVVLVYASDLLCCGQVTPTSGDNFTNFKYTVRWTGSSNPPHAYVHIDGGQGVMMTLYDFTSGSYKYEYYTRLGSGNHNFYFTDDSEGEGGRDPNTGVYVGPQVE